MRMLRNMCIAALAMLLLPLLSAAQNPYLPMWEYIPDGEPYVFEDPDCPGSYRVYVYGSHDSLISEYCGREQVVWSAPVEDLGAWRYDGIIFKSVLGADGRDLKPGGVGDVLYAPDVALRVLPDGKKEYYLYPNNQEWGRNGQVAVSDRPDGPFRVINWNKDNPVVCDGVLAFDPAVFVDDDGRVYGYWGFESSNGAELDPQTMASVKPGTEIVRDMISSAKQPGEFRFFEASSIRKIEDKYVFIYSRTTAEGEFGLPAVNYTLAYAYGDSPLGPFTYGGTLIDCRGRDVDDSGKPVCTANPYGNTHGSILEINGQWWVFYHRQTGTDEFSRQAMVSPITVKVQKGRGGKVEISEAEYTSEGFSVGGLNPLHKTPAGLACYLTNPKGIGQSYPNFIFTGSYVKPTRLDPASCQGPFNQKQPFCPVVNNTSGSVVGYKYFNFDCFGGASRAELVLTLKPEAGGRITVLAGGPKESRGGRVIAAFDVAAGGGWAGAAASGSGVRVGDGLLRLTVPVTLPGLKGKQPLFFVFSSDAGDRSVCELYDFRFFVK